MGRRLRERVMVQLGPAEMISPNSLTHSPSSPLTPSPPLLCLSRREMRRARKGVLPALRGRGGDALPLPCPLQPEIHARIDDTGTRPGIVSHGLGVPIPGPPVDGSFTSSDAGSSVVPSWGVIVVIVVGVGVVVVPRESSRVES
jgi:hypothetical protein